MDPQPKTTDWHKRRANMVRSQIEARGIRDPRVLSAMHTTPRHLFVPRSQRSAAYQDGPLEIGEEQTISQPYIVALMSEQAHVKDTDRVLEIGTGSGYQTAILCQLAREVFSIERIPSLGYQARAVLEEMSFPNPHLRIGDGYAGWQEAAPFDVIFGTASAPEIPQELVRQLAPHGRMIMPIGLAGEPQSLLSIDAAGNETFLADVGFVPMVKGYK